MNLKTIVTGGSLCILLLLLTGTGRVHAASPWGENYFPNVPLLTDDGRTVRFFDDLVKNRVVAINFIYTHCAESCPLETAQLLQVQKLLGDRLGRDVHFYSISIDPENDTPEVLSRYKKRFGARWTFLTGAAADITLLRKKLGLYVEEIQDGSNNHNVSMIIGNQATGRWMKRSPFENPHVLADQLTYWLTDWKPARRQADYAQAPKLRDISRGELMFRTRCAACHTITGDEPEDALGPDLLAVTRLRDRQWLLDWLKAPEKMLQKKDPLAMDLYLKYKGLAMPNLRLNPTEANELLQYIEQETVRVLGADPAARTGATAATPAVVADVPDLQPASKLSAGR